MPGSDRTQADPFVQMHMGRGRQVRVKNLKRTTAVCKTPGCGRGIDDSISTCLSCIGVEANDEAPGALRGRSSLVLSFIIPRSYPACYRRLARSRDGAGEASGHHRILPAISCTLDKFLDSVSGYNFICQHLPNEHDGPKVVR